MKWTPKNLELTYNTIIVNEKGHDSLDIYNSSIEHITMAANNECLKQINDLLIKFANQHEIPGYTNTYMSSVDDIHKYGEGTVKVELNTTEVHVIYELNVALTYTCEF